MSPSASYYVMLFKAVSYALKAEKILKDKQLPHKLIPVPKQISSDCGICLRYDEQAQSDVEQALCARVEFEQIRQIVS